MKNNFKNFLTILAFLTFSKAANAYDFDLKEGKHLQLCREVKQMLDEPENKHFGEPFRAGPEFPISKKYKNFSLPTWKDIPASDLPKYMKKGPALKAIEDFNEGKQNGILLHGAKYGVTQKMQIQKTYIDFDGDGKRENIIRYRPGGNSIIYQKILWSLYVEDANEETTLSKRYNRHKTAKHFLFYYKGKTFESHGYGVAHGFGIYEIRFSHIPAQVNIFPVCELIIKDSQRKISSNLLQEYYKEGGVYKNKLKEMEESQKLKTNQ